MRKFKDSKKKSIEKFRKRVSSNNVARINFSTKISKCREKSMAKKTGGNNKTTEKRHKFSFVKKKCFQKTDHNACSQKHYEKFSKENFLKIKFCQMKKTKKHLCRMKLWKLEFI